ncbi:neutral zinc metallopeptidase [Rhodocytophaga aerolata]|uniref:Neutral zinc metallopeptidase n=1 Tax=Rhodocytophaga aerolata TaxID=455078 RepID=A0ABT8RG87_9BACT|nr:neutral zinc metallopeptidase [Rhodocytophaga aerolata]MDO1450716.1 neutral zinc metallopeptidase [Rhodocytophaga aerolata]
MKNLKLITTIIAFFLIVLSSCEKDHDSPVDMPAYNPYPELAEVDSVACEDPPLWNWIFFQQILGLGPKIIPILQDTNLIITELPFLHSVYFENSAANQSFGPNGEYTDQINKTFTDLKRFWDIELGNIILVAFRGSMLQDRNKVIATYKAEGYSDEKANAYADSVAILLQMNPDFLNGNHPAFTFNQLAPPDTTIAGVGQIPAKIVIGDGLFQGFDAIGYGDIAPQAILAHEYGHHIQYDLGVVVRGWQRGKEFIPKTARRIELMADAYAAYYLSHPRGAAAMQEENVQRFLELFFNLGDCKFKENSHHGTPAQRKAAAEWGYKLATDAQQRGRILPARELARLFDAELADIIKNGSI